MNGEVSGILNRAADVIVERGWTTGEIQDRRGAVCLVGALNLAITGNSLDPVFGNRKWSLAEAYLREVTDAPGHAWEWNDVPGRTKEQVIGALREAARIAGSD